MSPAPPIVVGTQPPDDVSELMTVRTAAPAPRFRRSAVHQNCRRKMCASYLRRRRGRRRGHLPRAPQDFPPYPVFSGGVAKDTRRKGSAQRDSHFCQRCAVM